MKGMHLLALCSVFAGPPLAADDAPGAREATDFLRVDQDEGAARLQTSVTRYEKDGATVDLLGAVHIADQAYYDDLKKRFPPKKRRPEESPGHPAKAWAGTPWTPSPRATNNRPASGSTASPGVPVVM